MIALRESYMQHALCSRSKGIPKTLSSFFWMSNDFPLAFLFKKMFYRIVPFFRWTWNWFWWNFEKSKVVLSRKIEFMEKNFVRTLNWFNKSKYLVWCWWRKGTNKRKQNKISTSGLNWMEKTHKLIQCQKREPKSWLSWIECLLHSK